MTWWNFKNQDRVEMDTSMDWSVEKIQVLYFLKIYEQFVKTNRLIQYERITVLHWRAKGISNQTHFNVCASS